MMRQNRGRIRCRTGRHAVPLRSVAVVASLWLFLGATLMLGPGTVAASPAGANSKAELYFGLMYPTTPDIKDLGTYETQIGKRVSLVLWYQSWKEGGQLQGFPTHQLDTVRQHGAIPVLAWEPDAYPAPGTGPQFPLAAIASGTWDSYLRDYATAAKAWGHPFFLRFASEMNGSWTPWSEFAPGNGAGQFVKAWRHVHDIFASVGATNVTWVWCPNIGDATTTPLAELYPGKATSIGRAWTATTIVWICTLYGTPSTRSSALPIPISSSCSHRPCRL